MLGLPLKRRYAKMTATRVTHKSGDRQFDSKLILSVCTQYVLHSMALIYKLIKYGDTSQIVHTRCVGYTRVVAKARSYVSGAVTAYFPAA